MTIIQTEKKTDGSHGIQSQSHRTSCWLPGYIEVPTHLESAVWATLGWCDLDIQDGVLVGVTPTERPAEPVVTPEPTDLEKLRADVDFLAAMGGVSL